MRIITLKATLTATAMLLSTTAALADPPIGVLARVASLQPPAWIEQDDQRTALQPGDAVQAGQGLATGDGGRLQLDFEDASVLQLGENSQLTLGELQLTDDGSTDGLLKAALSLVQGQLRFSGDPLRQRDIGLVLGDDMRLRLQDSDVWVSRQTEGTQVCLVQGSVRVDDAGLPAQTLDLSQTCLAGAPGQPLQRSSTSDADFSAALSQTEPEATQALLRAGGRFRVVLASVGTQAQADREIARLSDLGYPLEALPQQETGRTRYRLAIGGLPDHAQAKRLVQTLKQRLGITGWVLVPD